MTMRVDFRASNNADWQGAFSVTRRGVAGEPPWQNVAQWSAGEQYQSSVPASVASVAGNLYVASAEEITTGTFVEDEWILIGVASLFVAEPIDLTGASLKMRLLQEQNGSVDTDQPGVLLSTEQGDLILTSPTQGGISMLLPASKARGIVAGRYAYDMIASFPNGRIERLMLGFIDVEQGVSK